MKRVFTATITIFLAIGILVGFLSFSMLSSRVTVTESFTYTYTSKTVYTTTIRYTETVTITKSESEIKYARLFKITEFDDYKIVRDALNRTLILVPRNKSPPMGVEGIVIYVPVERVILMSATQVALLMRLKESRPDILDTVVGIMWGGQYEWYLKDIKEALNSGRIRDVGAPETPSYEEILMLNPDIVFIYAFPGMEVISKFDELGIRYAVINEYLENDYLGRFEWIKFVAAFYGLDAEAKEIFNRCEQTISSISIRVADRVPPNVAWFSIYKGTVYAAGGESYVAKALRQLNARYIFSDVKQTSSFVTTLEEILGHAGEIDVIVYPGIVSSLSDILAEAPGLSETNAIKQKRVYAYSSTIYQLGFYDVEGWYLDLAYILHPEEFPEHQLKYFISIAE